MPACSAALAAVFQGQPRTGPLAKMRAVPCALGHGLLAGLAGTVAMTLSSGLEARLRGRQGSSAPAEVAGKLLGVEPRDERGKARFSTIVHWSYGTGWGAVRGLLAVAGLSPLQAAVSHLGLVWSTELVMLPGLQATPPPWRWGGSELAIDAAHHTVYAGATSVAYTALARS
jgi:hypothetical protein